MDLPRRAVLLSGAALLTGGALVALTAETEAPLAEIDEAPRPPATVSPTRPVPADAIWLHPTGLDTNAGTQARPRLTPVGGRHNVLDGGRWDGFAFTAPENQLTTLQAAPGKSAVLDGGGSLPGALTASGLLNLFGNIVVQRYAPVSTSNGANAPVFFGGTSAGSEVDGLTVRQSAMAAIGFQNRIVLRHFTAEDCGYSAIMGSSADGSLFEDIRVSRVNRAGHSQDGQLAAMKLTWSSDVVVRRYQAYDVPNGSGFWLDAGCQDSDLSDFDIDGAGPDGVSRMDHGVLFEIGHGGTLTRARVRGAQTAGAMIASASGVTVTNSDLRDNFVCVWLKQDGRTNSGIDPRNGTPAENPWRTVGTRLRNLHLNGKNQLWAYASDEVDLPGKDMLDEARGIWFEPPRRGGIAIRFDNTAQSLAQFEAALGSRGGPNYMGSDARAAAKVRTSA